MFSPNRKGRIFPPRLVLFITLCLLAFPQMLCAVDHHWNSTYGTWNTGGNWDVGDQPEASEAVYIDNGFVSVVNLPGAVADTLSVSDTSALDIRDTGVLTIGGNSVAIGDGTSGTVNVTGGGKLYANSATLTLGTGTTALNRAVGLLNVDGLGSVVSVSSMIFADSTISNGHNTGYLNISAGGIVNVSGSVEMPSVSDGGFAEALVTGSGSRWNVGGNFSFGELGTGLLDITDGAGMSITGNLTMASESTAWLNVFGAELTVGGTIYAGSTDWGTHMAIRVQDSTLNAANIVPAGNLGGAMNPLIKLAVMGSGSDITLSAASNATAGMSKYFYIDSTDEGITPIVATSGTIDLSGEYYFAAQGMAVQKSDNEFVILDATAAGASLTGTLGGVNSPVTASASGDKLTIAFDPDAYEVWNPKENPYLLLALEDPQSGWLRIDERLCGDQIIARFFSNKTAFGELSTAFIEYLNAGMPAGYKVTMLGFSDGYLDVSIPTSLFAEYDMLGWGLHEFSEIHGLGSVTLHDLFYVDVPEPSTWAMMLTGGLAILWLRKRRRA